MMPAVRTKARKYSSQEDAYLLNYREWRNDKVSESWAQFLARYEKRFWIDPHSSSSLLYRAQRISGCRFQTLSHDDEMMQHMLKIRKSSLWWTWGRVAQAFGTNANTASKAYKSFLERHGINEVQEEFNRVHWTKSEMRKLSRARHLGYSWERIAKLSGYEEYICIAAHYIHSYGDTRSGNLNTSFHPKYFFHTREKARLALIRRSSSGIKTDEKSREHRLEKDVLMQDREEKLTPKLDAKEVKPYGGTYPRLISRAVRPVKEESTSGMEYKHQFISCGLTSQPYQIQASGYQTTAGTFRGGIGAGASIIMRKSMGGTSGI